MRRRDFQAAALIALTLLAAAFLLGSAPRWATCVSAGLGALCALPYLRSSGAIAGGPLKAPLLVFLGLGFGFTLLQLIPLPSALTQLISPARFELAADNAAALGNDPPALIPLSVDPPATLVELAKLSGYILFAYACLRLAASGSRGRAALLGAVVTSGTAISLTALGHRAFDASSVFGLYEPMYASPSYLSPFINANHLSAYAGLSAALALGLALRASGPLRALWLGALFTCAGVALLAGSRGGATALCIGLLAIGALYALHRRRTRATAPRRGRAPRAKSAALAVILACAAVVVATLTAGPVASQLAESATTEELKTETRFALWGASTELIREYPATGVGRGAFVHAFPRVYEYSRLYAYLENGYLQAVVDFGLPAALALSGALALFAVAAARRVASARATGLEIGALGGLILLAVHNFVDFNLELPGVAMAAVAAAACATPPTLTRVRPRGSRRPLLLRIGALAAAAAVIALAASPLGSLARAQTQLGLAKERGTEAAKAAFSRHPSSFIAAGELAYALYRDGDPRALRVANRALFLSPEHPDIHLLTARILIATGYPEQALVHYRQALKSGGARRPVIREIISRYSDRDEAVRGFPLDARRFPRLLGRIRGEDPELALLYSRRYERLAADDDPAALLAISDIERRAGDLDRAIAAAEAARDARPGAETARALARALDDAERRDDAIAALEADLPAIEAPADRADVLAQLADVQKRDGDLHAARDNLHEITESVVPRRVAARAHRRLAEIEDELENHHQADWHRRRAERLRE